MLSPMSILILMLVASLAGNAWQFRTYLGVRDQRTEAIGERDQARSAANACSDATEALVDLAGKRKKENEAERRRAYEAGAKSQVKAQQILSAPPSKPGDDCGSAVDRFDGWLAGRGRP